MRSRRWPTPPKACYRAESENLALKVDLGHMVSPAPAVAGPQPVWRGQPRAWRVALVRRAACRRRVDAVGDTASIVIVSENARVRRKVKAGHVIIVGSGTGPVEAPERVELQAKARIRGDVRDAAFDLHQRAVIDGELRRLQFESRVALKLAASGPR